MGAITEQELPTKHIRNKRGCYLGKTSTCNSKCRLCHTAIEDVTHVICNCPEMSARYYLPYAVTEWEKNIIKFSYAKTLP